MNTKAAPQPRILVVDDDVRLRDLLTRYLAEQGFDAKAIADARDLDKRLQRDPPALLVLDLMLPGEDGLAVCRRLRASGEDVPIIMLTAKGEDVDRIVGLEMGADDYLPKPFNPRELVARVRAILRRTRVQNRVAAPAPTERYIFMGWTLDAGSRALSNPDGLDIELTGGEFDLLLSFVTHAQRVLNRDQLLDWTRGRSAGPFDRAIDVQLSRLRRKLAEHPSGANLIKTVRGGGYLFAAPVERT